MMMLMQLSLGTALVCFQFRPVFKGLRKGLRYRREVIHQICISNEWLIGLPVTDHCMKSFSYKHKQPAICRKPWGCWPSLEDKQNFWSFLRTESVGVARFLVEMVRPKARKKGDFQQKTQNTKYFVFQITFNYKTMYNSLARLPEYSASINIFSLILLHGLSS